MLLALTRPCRGADLAALDVNQRQYVPEGVVILPSHLSKQSRPSHHGVEFFFPYFKEDLVLCPVETLKVYEQKTSSFRKPSSISEPNQLLRSFIGRHGPLSSSTIARWLKAGLQSAGVDIKTSGSESRPRKIELASAHKRTQRLPRIFYT